MYSMYSMYFSVCNVYTQYRLYYTACVLLHTIVSRSIVLLLFVYLYIIIEYVRNIVCVRACVWCEY